jgi:hypothetical protein
MEKPWKIINQYGTATINDALLKIAIKWHSSFPAEQLLFINDMSLPYGGLFDVNGQWNTSGGHSSHRIGTDVDIRSELPAGICSTYPNGREGIPIRNPENRNNPSLSLDILKVNRFFRNICSTYGATPNIHGYVNRQGVHTPCNEHIHIDF